MYGSDAFESSFGSPQWNDGSFRFVKKMKRQEKIPFAVTAEALFLQPLAEVAQLVRASDS